MDFDSDGDEGYPVSKCGIPWDSINTDYTFADVRKFSDVEHICDQNGDKLIDMRPYMLERPYHLSPKDKLQKIVDLFRQMHLRQIPIVKDSNGEVVGIITRQDIFSYMSL